MTKRDFELIAKTIREMNLGAGEEADDLRGKIAMAFARSLTTTNPRFDTQRFVDACMPA